VRNFSEAVAKLVEEFQKRSKSNFLVNLSGGFRLLILETLIAVILTEINARVEVELEDSSATVEFPVRWITSKILDEEARKILRMLKEKTKSPSEIVESTGLSKTTVWRRLGKLRDVEIVSYNESENKYSLTEIGKILLSIK